MTDTVVDEDRLPWLEAVDDQELGEGPSLAKLVGAIVIGLVAIGIIVGGLFWLGSRGSRQGNGEIIAAPKGDYKVRPDQPGGMNVSGTGESAYAASAGAEPKGRLNTNAVPEAPVRPAPAASPNPVVTPAARPAAPAPRPSPPASAAPAAGPAIQLGAFSSEAAASRAWAALSARFRYLAPLSHSVVPVQAAGRTLYRLRASGAGSAEICRRLQIAGEDCAAVG